MENTHFDHSKKRYVLSPSEQKSRREFVRKVILHTLGMLFFTLGLLIPATFVNFVRDFLNEEPKLCPVVTILTVGFTFVLVCCSWAGRVEGLNYFLLFIITAFTSSWGSCTCVKYDHSKVVIAILLSVVITTVLCFTAALISRDFTVIYGILLIVTFIALILGVVYFVVVMYLHISNPRLKWAITIGSLVLTCVYVMSDTQLIITGDRTFFLDVHSHVLGAAILYIDFVYLFIYWLCIVGEFEGFKMKF